MLSIGKIGGGQGDPRYYTNSVASGREDYYTGHGEAEGEWTGHGATKRGLAGSVEEDDFLNLLTADPAQAKTVLGYDLTFSAPKSVSILYGVGDESTSCAVRDAHDEAVRQALGYIERHACWTRRGPGGRQHLRGEGLTIATFRHRSSRAGDPQLHTHAVVANATNAAGKTGALDGRALYAHARTAGFLYQAALRHELTRTVGVEWEPVQHGAAEIADISEDLRRHFSQRRDEIKEHMTRHGGRSAHSAQIAALETRRTKDYNISSAGLHDTWRARAAEHGLDRAVLEALCDRRAPGLPAAPPRHEVVDHLASFAGITRNASTFDRRDALRDWAEAQHEGAPVEEVERLADEWLASPAAVVVEPGTERMYLGGPRYSTPEMLQIERDLVETARTRRGTGVAQAAEPAVDEVLATELQLTDEQAKLARQLTRSGHGVEVVRAPAGTGKTYALAAARDIWERSGVRVFGCALAARAAVEMESTAGIDATTIARLRQDIATGYGLPRGSVLVVDEAGMVGTRAIADLARHAADTDSKLVLVGDDRQLPEIDAGGAFRGLADRLGCAELHEVQRQSESWDRAALSALRRGRIRTWFDAYRDHGRLVARPTAAGVREALVDDWWESARDGREDTIMIAPRRADVADLNALARSRLHRDGRLGDEELAAGNRRFSVGDRVIARRNDRRAGVVNGLRGEVAAIDPERRTLQLRTGPDQVHELDATYLDDGWLDHGYALTAHAAQGATVDRAFVLGSDDLYREWGYTALSRHRREARFYVVSPGSVERALPGLERDPDPIAEDVVPMLGPSRRKELAHDSLKRAKRPAVDVDEAMAEVEMYRNRLRELADERGALKPWQRGRRSTVDQLIQENQEALARWNDDLALVSARETPRRASGALLLDREAILEPPRMVEARIGPRPDRLGERETWARAALALMRDPMPVRDVPMERPTMSDTGLDL